MVDKFANTFNCLLNRHYRLLLAAALSSTLLLKASLVYMGRVPFNSDEAIVGLMARHILKGEHPIFFYGQSYMGSLDAYLTAVGFFLFGDHVWVMRAVQAVLYLGTILTGAIILWEITGSRAATAAGVWLLAIPTINVTLYTTVSLGGYGEMLLIGNLILLVTMRIARNIQMGIESDTLFLWLSLGFLIGLGLWSFGLSLVYAFGSFMYLAWIILKMRTRLFGDPCTGEGQPVPFRSPVYYFSIFAVVSGIAIGAAPWLWFAGNSGFNSLFKELSGGAIAGVEGLNLLGTIVRRAFNFIVLGSTVVIGLRPPWEIRWLAMPLAPAAILFWGGVLGNVIRKTRQEIRSQVLSGISYVPLFSGVLLTLGLGFCLTPFGADPSGRYFLPVSVILTILAVQVIQGWRNKYTRWIYLIVPVIIAFNLWGTVQAASERLPGLTTQFDAITQIDHKYDAELIQFLHSTGETRGYTNYWVAYPLAFLSKEEMIYIPRLPYHEDFRYTTRDDRYPAYRRVVESSARVAYITTNHPDLNSYLRQQFKARNITWEEKIIGDYQIFFELSERIEPEDMGLGVETQ